MPISTRRAEIIAPLVGAVLADVMRFDERAVGLTPTPAIGWAWDTSSMLTGR